MKNLIIILTVLLSLALVFIPVGKQTEQAAEAPAPDTAGTAESVTAELPEFEIDGTTLVKYNGYGGEVTVPDGIEYIGEEAFWGSQVTKVVLPDTLRHLASYSFWGCERLREITLPASVEDIEMNPDGSSYQAQVFAFNTSLEKIGVDPGNTKYREIDGVLYTMDGKTLLYYPAGKNRGGTYEIPEGTAELGYSSINGAALTSVTIPASLTGSVSNELKIKTLEEIILEPGNGAYSVKDGVLYTRDGETLVCYPCAKGPEKLEKQDFPAGLKRLGEWAFQNDTKLTEIELPEGLEEIGWMCFDWAESLRKVTLPASLRCIDGYAFTGCQSLEDVVFFSPDVVIETMEESIFDRSPKVVIYGYDGSTADEYAQRFNIPFASLGPIPAGEEETEGAAE